MRDIEKQLLGHAEIGDLDGPNGVISVLKTGINVDIQDKHGKTALMWAAWDGYTEIVDILIQAGANMFIKDKDDKTALDMATEKGHTQTTELIKQRMVEQKKMEQERSVGSTNIYNMSRWL